MTQHKGLLNPAMFGWCPHEEISVEILGHGSASLGAYILVCFAVPN